MTFRAILATYFWILESNLPCRFSWPLQAERQQLFLFLDDLSQWSVA